MNTEGMTVPFDEKLLDMLDKAAIASSDRRRGNDNPAITCRTVLVGVKNGLIEVKNLRAIVAKLPKTGDGIPVIPRMTLWRKHGDHMRDTKDFWHGFAFYHDWYSTREAAEAAAKE